MRRLFAVTAVLVAMITGAFAQSVGEADRMQFRSIITGQIEAFRSDDGARAYGYAAPIIKQIFPSPEQFMAMVKQGYQPVYRPQSFAFGATETDPTGRPIQRVKIVGPDGLTYEAIYTMERQPDGSWQISGCRLVRTDDLSA